MRLLLKILLTVITLKISFSTVFLEEASRYSSLYKAKTSEKWRKLQRTGEFSLL